MKRRGTLVVNVRLTRAAKRALARTRLAKIRVTAKVTLSKRGYRAATVARPLVLRR
ncbi:MAG: hypothetical protein GXY03_04305 [Solirubrobacterales bacterium]|nr:hypothetical protein [Solirubrobacterales bacterium]